MTGSRGDLKSATALSKIATQTALTPSIGAYFITVTFAYMHVPCLRALYWFVALPY